MGSLVSVFVSFMVVLLSWLSLSLSSGFGFLFRRISCIGHRCWFLAAKVENAANRLGYHPFFVRANNADGNPAGRRGNHALIHSVSLLFEFDSKESQPIANSGADRGRILSDAAGEHQRL
jgi:hypothetical protein